MRSPNDGAARKDACTQNARRGPLAFVFGACARAEERYIDATQLGCDTKLHVKAALYGSGAHALSRAREQLSRGAARSEWGPALNARTYECVLYVLYVCVQCVMDWQVLLVCCRVKDL